MSRLQALIAAVRADIHLAVLVGIAVLLAIFALILIGKALRRDL